MTQETVSRDNAREIVAFHVADQEYGIDIMSVREIRSSSDETALPHSPHYVRGVINLRGAVLPVIDLAARFGRPPKDDNRRNVIMVAQVGPQLIGLLVDSVADILAVSPECLQTTPSVASSDARNYVDCVAAIDDRLIQLLNLELICEHAHPLAA